MKKIYDSDLMEVNYIQEFYQALKDDDIKKLNILVRMYKNDIVRDLYENKSYKLERAKQESNLELVKSLLLMAPDQEAREKTMNYLFGRSARNGRLWILQYLVGLAPLDKIKNMLYYRDGYAFIQAAANFDLETLQYLIELTPTLNNEDHIFLLAAANGDLGMLRYLAEQTPALNKKEFILHLKLNCAFLLAARRCHLNIIKYLIGLTLDVSSKDKIIHSVADYAAIMAVQEGNLEMLQYLVGSTSDLNKIALMLHRHYDLLFRIAAQNGYLTILEYLVRLTPDPIVRSIMIHTYENTAFFLAARYGHLDVLRYLVELTEPNSKERSDMIHGRKDKAFFLGGRYGHLEILKYLIELTPNPDDLGSMLDVREYYALYAAAYNGHLDIIKYAVKLLLLPKNQVFSMCYNTIGRGWINVVDYLMTLLSDKERASLIMCKYPSGISIEMVEYLLSIATREQALLFIRYNITLRLSSKAIITQAMHTLWYILDSAVSKSVFNQIKERRCIKASPLMYLSFLSSAAKVRGESDLGILAHNALEFLNTINIPLVIRDNQPKSLLILDIMFLSITRLYRVCKDRDKFGIFSLPLELIPEILWINISEGITDLIPAPQRCLNVLGNIISFYSIVGSDQILEGFDRKIPEYNIVYTLSLLERFGEWCKNNIKGIE